MTFQAPAKRMGRANRYIAKFVVQPAQAGDETLARCRTPSRTNAAPGDQE